MRFHNHCSNKFHNHWSQFYSCSCNIKAILDHSNFQLCFPLKKEIGVVKRIKDTIVITESIKKSRKINFLHISYANHQAPILWEGNNEIFHPPSRLVVSSKSILLLITIWLIPLHLHLQIITWEIGQTVLHRGLDVIDSSC